MAIRCHHLRCCFSLADASAAAAWLFEVECDLPLRVDALRDGASTAPNSSASPDDEFEFEFVRECECVDVDVECVVKLPSCPTCELVTDADADLYPEVSTVARGCGGGGGGST